VGPWHACNRQPEAVIVDATDRCFVLLVFFRVMRVHANCTVSPTENFHNKVLVQESLLKQQNDHERLRCLALEKTHRNWRALNWSSLSCSLQRISQEFSLNFLAVRHCQWLCSTSRHQNKRCKLPSCAKQVTVASNGTTGRGSKNVRIKVCEGLQNCCRK
jgi:hypothetical protein